MPKRAPIAQLDIADQLLYAAEAEECRRSFKLFIRKAWDILEPGTPLKWNWHLDAIAEHLQACYEGQIKRLVVSIGPGHSKSTVISQAFPMWVWTNKPTYRWLCASTTQDLAIRDNRNSRYLVESEWFRKCYGKEFKLNQTQFEMSQDQSAKSFFENDHKGYRMSVGIGARGIGKRGDGLLCLCYNEEVTTDEGRIRIGDIVEHKLPVQVLAFDHVTNTAHWQKIEKYEVSPGRACVRVTFTDGRTVDSTTDHPYYVVGRGYVPAAQLTSTDEVVTDDRYLRNLREDLRLQTEETKSKASLLQQGLSRYLPTGRKAGVHGSMRSLRNVSRTHTGQACAISTRFLQYDMQDSLGTGNKSPRLSGQSKYLYLRSMRERIYPPVKGCRESQASFLRSNLFQGMEQRGKQSSVSGRASRKHLYEVWESVLCRSSSRCKKRVNLLFTRMLASVHAWRSVSVLSRYIRQLCLLWYANKDHQTQGREEELLFSQLCQHRAQSPYQRGEQSEIRGRRSVGTISEGVSGVSSIGTSTRPSAMPSLPYDERTEWQGTRRSPYRLRQRSQRTLQPGNSLSLVSRQDAWLRRAETRVETLLVRCVEPIPTPERVYNLRVATDHNFYANGILTHNCDDPHDPMEGDIRRQEVLDWFAQTWISRLNDQENGTMIIVGQRIHDEDLSGHVLRLGGWEHLNLPEEYEPTRKCFTSIGWCDPRDREGELLWPEKFSQEVLNKLKEALGTFGFHAQYQQSPVPAKGGTFQEAWKRYFEIEGDYYILHTKYGTRKPVPIRSCQRYCVVDVAISEKQQADFTAIQTWDVTPENEALLLHQLRGHFNNPDQQKKTVELYEYWLWMSLYVETVAYQLALFQQLKNYSKEEEIAPGIYRKRIINIPVREFRPVRDKVARATVAAIKMEAGDMYFLMNAPYLTELEPEVFKFPKSKKKDQVDCLAMICDILSNPRIPLSGDETTPIDYSVHGLTDHETAQRLSNYTDTVYLARTHEAELDREIAEIRKQLLEIQPERTVPL